MDAGTTWPSARLRPKDQVAEHVCCGASGGLPFTASFCVVTGLLLRDFVLSYRFMGMS